MAKITKMNKLLLTILSICLYTNTIFAQSPSPNDLTIQREVKVLGKIIDIETKEPLEYATISFFSKQQNKVVTGGITDIQGNFNVSVPIGMYDISIEYISFKTIKIGDRRINSRTELGTFEMEVDAQALDAVEVIAERTTVEIKLDKKIYNVGKDLTVSGGTVSDVLDNVPSVSVDVEGNVALRGNDDVRILINGKPSGLVGLNSTDALRQLPAESIERVEVITSPSARYDAEGTAGILNIILRRSKLQGMNGAITANLGHPTSAGVSGNINFRTGDLNIFNTTGYNYRESPGNSSSETEFFNGSNPSSFLNESRESNRVRDGLNTNFGVEWYVNDNSSITTSIVYRKSDNKNNTETILDELDASGGLLDKTIRTDPEFEDDKTVQYSFNYDKQFNGNSQHRLTFDFQYENSEETEESFINQNGLDIEHVVTGETQDRVFLQTDFVKPVGTNGQFELGYRGNFERAENDYLVEQSDDGINFVNNTNLSNSLSFRQDINAFYTQFGNRIGEKFSYLLGLRYEETRRTIIQPTSTDFAEIAGDGFDRKVFNQLFPTLNLGYTISEDQNVTFGYNRRIRRPRSYFMNPFPSRSSATSIFLGNPALDPSVSDAFDLGYLNRFGKLTLNSSVYFQRAKDVFSFISRGTDFFYIFETNQTINVNDPNFDDLNNQYDLVPVIARGPINLATNERFGFEFTLTYRPSRKWNMNGNFNLFNSVTKGEFNGQILDAENLSWFIRFNNKYTLPGKIDWQTRIFYMGPSETAQSKSKGMFSTDLAFSKDLFKEKASLAVRVSDLFNSRKRISETFTDTFEGTSEFQWRQRSYNLTFTYRFNQKKKRERGRGNYDGGEEMMEF